MAATIRTTNMADGYVAVTRHADSTYQQEQIGWDSGLLDSRHGHQEHIAWAGGFSCRTVVRYPPPGSDAKSPRQLKTQFLVRGNSQPDWEDLPTVGIYVGSGLLSVLRTSPSSRAFVVRFSLCVAPGRPQRSSHVGNLARLRPGYIPNTNVGTKLVPNSFSSGRSRRAHHSS